ncbi:MAG: hypothetical protein IJ072_05130 [Oscillospiraceae bacterium]|nr:hypothetical protein [Oscillospiraceae bacterium]
MRARTKKLTVCAMFAALGAVVLLVGGAIGIGTYAAPVMAGFMVIPVRRELGVKYALAVWIVTGALTLMLSGDREMALVYIAIFGWYPAAKPALDRLGAVGWVIKLVAFNAIAAGLYMALFAVMGGMAALGFDSTAAALVMLAVGDAVFIIYDIALKNLDRLYMKKLRARLFPGRGKDE